MAVSTELLKGVPDEQKKDFEATLRNSTTLLLTLQRVLKDRLKNIHLEQSRSMDYDTAAWPFKQAARNGKYAAYQELLSLLTFKEK
jgi:hypothetical protein